MLRRWGFVFIVPAVFISDRLLKSWVISRFREGEGIPVLRGVLHLTRVNNTGAAFGILRQSSFFLVLISLACIFFLCWCLWKRNAPSVRNMAWCLVLGGALGNLYDRLAYGYVVDFLDLRVWPVFNLADAAISLGVALAFLSFWGHEEGRS